MSLHIIRIRALAAILLLSAQGCSASPKQVADAEPPSLELGTGTGAFEVLEDGDDIFIVQGPQGGYHFFGALRARNVNPGDSEDLSDSSNPTTTFEAFVGDARIDGMFSTYRQGLEVSNGYAEMIGRQVILDILDDEDLDGATVRFGVRFEDVDGVMLSDERTLTAVKHPDNL